MVVAMESRTKLIQMIQGIAVRHGPSQVLGAMIDQMSGSALSRLATELARHFKDGTDDTLKLLERAIPQSTELQRMRAVENARAAANDNPHMLQALALQMLAGMVHDEI
jgi:hypothetical protein